MNIDKVANTPPLAMSEGWPAKDINLSGSQEAASNESAVKTGGGAAVSEEKPERHNVADPSQSPAHQRPATSPFLPVDPKPSPRLLAVQEDEAGDSDSDDPSQAKTLASKTASFYIGGDETRSPPPPRVGKQNPVTTAAPAAPWKVPGEGTAVVEFTPPDGGYSWVVALAACFINLWIIGFVKSYGVLYVAIREAFPEASAYHISWLPSLLSTVGLLTAPVTGIMCRRFTSRKVSFFGGFLCFLGLLLGSQAVNINHLIFSVGLLTGLGSGITTTSGILIVSLYFERRRTFGSSICLSGNALGGFFLPPVVDHLLKTYGLRGALLILAALQLHICAASLLFRPISHHAIVQAAELKRKARTESAKDQLIPSVTAFPQSRASPPSHLKAFWWRVRQRYVSSESVKEQELQHQVSFLRSASMMNSVPNLTLYARSWSVPGGPSLTESRPSFIVGSKSSLSNNSTSKWSLSKLSLFAEHPSVLRLNSEDESTGRCSPVHMHQHGGSRRSSLPRVLGVGVDRRPSLSRQTSIRTVQNRIMESVLEQDKEDTQEILRTALAECNEVDEDEIIERVKGRKKENMNGVIKKETKDIEKDKTVQVEDDKEIIRKSNCCVQCLRGLCDASLFQDGLFWVVAISVFLVACGTPFSLFYLPSYAESIDISSSVTTSMLSISSILDLVGRLGCGFVSDLHIFQLHHVYFFSALAGGVATLTLPHITSASGLTAVLCLFGFSIGSWFVMIPAMLAAHHGASKLAASYGMVRLFNGIMNFISPQATGVVYDATQSYTAVYTVMGSSMVAGSVLVLLAPLFRRKKNKNSDSANKGITSDEYKKNSKVKEDNPDDNIA